VSHVYELHALLPSNASSDSYPLRCQYPPPSDNSYRWVYHHPNVRTFGAGWRQVYAILSIRTRHDYNG
jgi:hypothetical protein